MITKKGLLKLIKTPKKFIKDYINKKKQKNYKEVIISESENKIKIEKNNWKNYQSFLDFNIQYIIQELNSYKVKGIFIKPLTNNLKWAICIKESDKEEFINTFLKMLYNNRISLKYKINNKIKKFANVKDFYNDLKELKSIDIRLKTDRSINKSFFWFRLEFWEEKENFYLAPKNNIISRKLYKTTANRYGIFKSERLINYYDILDFPHELDSKFKVDLVFTWVNSEDDDWKKMFEKYKPFVEQDLTDATSRSRFLNRDELKYALRSWDKYGSFINNIYIVSNCKPPSWLNLEIKNINWVYHEEIMPEEILPTFNSHAIETSLHKINGLSNYFIYSNDDVFLLRPSFIEDFFYSNGIVKLKFEPYGNVNGDVIESDPDYLNAARNVKKILEKSFKKSVTHLHTHSSQAMRVDILLKMEKEYNEYFKRTMQNKFRTKNDISVASFMYPHYAYLIGSAIYSDIKVELVQQRHNFVKKLDEILILHKNQDFNKMPLSICLNDGGDSYLNNKWNEKIEIFLETLFPNKSKYEI